MRIYVLDGGGPKDSENILNSFLTKRDEDVFWQIGTDLESFRNSQKKIKLIYEFWKLQFWERSDG